MGEAPMLHSCGDVGLNQVGFDGTDGNFSPVENAGGQGSLRVGLGKDFTKVLDLACAAGRDHGDLYGRLDIPHEGNVKARVGAVLVYAIEQNLSCPQV